MKQLYADVIVDISVSALDRSFQYIIPEALREEIQEGSRVIVPFGKGERRVAGYVIGLGDTPKVEADRLKEIEACPENARSVEDRLIRLAAWMKRTYGSTFIQALKTVLPVKSRIRRRRKSSEPSVAAGVAAGDDLRDLPELNGQQQAVYTGIRAAFSEKTPRPCLLRGVTGSGKTQVYMHLIRDVLRQGRQAILLIPEISLTWQTVSRFTACFGSRTAVLHSRLSAGEKSELVEKVKKKEVSLVIGPRSALFTPFEELGLIIVDEEHDTSYESEVTPRYHAAEVAVQRAYQEGANVLLGSATPSLESRYLCETGRYALFALDSRFAGAVVPDIRVIDMRGELSHGRKALISRELEDCIAERLEKGEQSILFLNRRGHTGFFSCRSCGGVIKCPHCDVALTWHKNGNLMCHYCGHTQPMVDLCPACGSPYIGGLKAGTQQVEELLKKTFPQARVVRMDRDTTTAKHGHEEILKGFAAGEADILVGTQMIVKGHDFPNVTLVGAVLADTSLFGSDYRAAERTFQLLVQAVGRAGRAQKAGIGIIQTYNPEHYAIQASKEQDYEAFYREEMENRLLLHYPPVQNLLTMHGSGKDEERLANAMLHMRKYLESIVPEGCSLLGPVAEPVAKVQDQYRMVLYLKNAGREDIIKCRQYAEKYIAINSGFDGIQIQFSLNE